jgi:hypothetical protein
MYVPWPLKIPPSGIQSSLVLGNSALEISAFSPVRYSNIRHSVTSGLQSNSAFEISALSPIRHSKTRHSVQFGTGEFGIRDFGIKSLSVFENSAFSPIRYWGFGVQEFGIMSFGIQSVNLCDGPPRILAEIKPFRTDSINTKLRISPRIFVRIRNDPNGILRGPRKLIHEKTLKTKIFC